MKGVEVSPKGCQIKDYPIWEPAPNEILIKNVAVSSNPKDWKVPKWRNRSNIEGNDVAGHVEKVGSDVKDFKQGDKVAAFTVMATDDKYGAYAEYTVSPAHTAFHLGPKTSFEDASTLPLAYMTAAIGLFKRLGIPEPDVVQSTGEPLLIYGGATSVGIYAIQLAKMAGMETYVVAGSSGDAARSYGADHVVDYRNKSNEQLEQELVALGVPFKYAYDAVTEKGSTDICVNVLSKTHPADFEGRMTFVLPWEGKYPSGVSGERTMVGTAHQDDSEFAQKWFGKLTQWLEDGTYRPQKVTVVPGGLEGVKEGLRRLEAGEAKAEKYVYRIAETPGLQQ